jgi:RNA polymerase sigma-70 factor, ECF subfamily
LSLAAKVVKKHHRLIKGFIRMDAATIAALKRRHPATCGKVVVEYTPMLLRTAQRILKNQAEAEDVVQEGFIKAFEHLDRLEAPERFGPWLKRIVINQTITRYRSKVRSPERSIEDLLPRFDEEQVRIDWPDETAIDAEASLCRKSVRDAVRAAVESLPEGYRVVIVLRDIEELSTREAADILGIEESALKVRLHRARSALRKLLEPAWREAVA